MDKINQYHKIIGSVLREYATIKKTLRPSVKSYLIIDENNHHYQLVSMGWHQQKYIYTVALHINIRKDKVWIQQNNTDILIADELAEKGIQKSDIILGFVPEKYRSYTGFAVK